MDGQGFTKTAGRPALLAGATEMTPRTSNVVVRAIANPDAGAGTSDVNLAAEDGRRVRFRRWT
jgi:hypothetical protein